MSLDMCYFIKPEQHNKKDLIRILEKNTQIKFVSLAGVDLVGHETDEKIPIKLFLENIDDFLEKTAVQTDGSSVYLPEIATLNDAKIDMKVDLDVNWFVDYNYDNLDESSKLPVGTLKIPVFLYHNNIAVDSRHILNMAVSYFEKEILRLIENHKEQFRDYGIEFEDIDKIMITSATELEFWVKTPDYERELEELTSSQELHEQYWAKTRAEVRTALENTLLEMEKYGFNPEMGHKEVGGVKAKLNQDGSLSGIMEQLEIDWKYDDALQTADNEMFIKNIIREIFRQNGMDVTFLAKPIQGVAGSGEHTHFGVVVKLKNGKNVNLFSPVKKHFLSKIGYGALMGVLKNYEIINPFITSSNEAFKRLKKGFEAPICIATSLGSDFDTPSRNRTILIGLIRDNENPLATHFELRSPNPHTNTYLCIASVLMSMIDGIDYALSNDIDEDNLLRELSKEYGEEYNYLEKYRVYRTENNIFDDYSDEEREKMFGKVPFNVFENVKYFNEQKEKLSVLYKGEVFTPKIIESYTIAIIDKWLTEIEYRIIPNFIKEIRNYKLLHNLDSSNELDIINWAKIERLRNELMKDNSNVNSLFTQIKKAISERNLEKVSELQKEIYQKMDCLQELYSRYKLNLLDI
ncbi:glutamine synthetase [Soehngenia longivitae]|uniref:glutamine synthetase n=1 Tax=Soehngenia longivitae TaxID=2562294 RepID=A0A4Z0DA43_9FIRM|nr:glutamine synthetase [Soehngenia longivitae]TFZ41769.1 glutamine synthetase [Soehngenia longivitae]